MDHDSLFTGCEKRMDSQAKDIERLDLEVSGVSPPGLCTRLDRLEQAHARQAKMSGLLMGGIVAALAAAVAAFLVG